MDEEKSLIYTSRSTILEIPQWRDDIVTLQMIDPLDEYFVEIF